MDTGDWSIQILVIGAIFFIIFFFFFQPSQKKKKERDLFLANLKIGDKLVTMAGIHGVVIGIMDTQVVLLMEDGKSKFLIEKEGISVEATEAIYRKVPETKKK